MNEKQYYVYIITNKIHTVLYIGVTSDLIKRIYQHKNKLVKGFTEKYNIDRLVYFEATTDIMSAITREKQLKKWKREWKERLINEKNSEWKDLYEDLIK